MSSSEPTLLTVTAPALVQAEDDAGVKRNPEGEVLPPGELLADIVHAELGQSGWKVEYRWTTYSAHAFDAQRGDNRYDIEVTLRDHDAARYTISARPRPGLMRRIFAGRIDHTEMQLLRMHIDTAIAKDARISVEVPWSVAAD